jgi:hypothetical protein
MDETPLSRVGPTRTGAARMSTPPPWARTVLADPSADHRPLAPWI